MTRSSYGRLGAIAVALAVSTMLAMPADARRGGSFGSRGARTYHAPAATNTAPRPVAPVQRSMTPNQNAAQAPGVARQAAPAGRFGGMAKGLIGGLIAGGLIAALMGGGFGALGGSGMIMALLQAALIGGAIWFAIRLFRRRSAAAPAPAFAGGNAAYMAPPAMGNPFARQPVDAPAAGAGGSFGFAPPAQADIPIEQADRDAFERLLVEVQDAFGREDYAGLRARTTPEIMSWLAEELGQNATEGRRNEVSATRLLSADVSEAWNEGRIDYATIAMHYESIDVMRDRTSGALVSGSVDRPTGTTEIWTFARDIGGPWLLSAIQEA